MVAPSETRSHSSTDWRNFQTRISAQSGARHGLPRRTTESLREHSPPLRPLAPGEIVFLQNQQGASSTKWDRSGIVVESLGHDQYRVKIDGSGRLTLRNRRFLRTYTPATPSIELQPATCLHLLKPFVPLHSRHHRWNASQRRAPILRCRYQIARRGPFLHSQRPPLVACPRSILHCPLPRAPPRLSTPPQTMSPQVLPSKRRAAQGTSSTTSLGTTVIVTPLTPATIPANVGRRNVLNPSLAFSLGRPLSLSTYMTVASRTGGHAECLTSFKERLLKNISLHNSLARYRAFF